MASIKISKVAIALLILTFSIGMWSFFIAEADTSASVDSGILVDSLSGYDSNLSTTKTTMMDTLSQNIDNQTEFTIAEQQLLEDRASETAGILNLFSKNVLISFLNNVSDKLSVPGIIKDFVILLLSLIILIAVVTFFWGDNKI